MIYKTLLPQKFSLVVLKTALYSILMNVLLYVLFERLGVIHKTVFINDDPNMPITLGPVIISSIVPTLLGGLVFWLMVRYLKKGVTVFGITAVTLGLLSFAMPFSLPEVPLGMAMALNLMHVVVIYNMLHYFRKSPHQ
jgi:hypothetical protein